MRWLRASLGLDPDGGTTILAGIAIGTRGPFGVVDVSDDPLATKVAEAARSKTNGPGGAA